MKSYDKAVAAPIRVELANVLPQQTRLLSALTTDLPPSANLNYDTTVRNPDMHAVLYTMMAPVLACSTP